MRDGFRIFDAHTHIGEWGRWEMKGREVEPFDREFTTKEELREHMEKYGIDRQIVMPHYHPDLSRTFELNRLAVRMAELEDVYAGIFFEPSSDNLETVRSLAGDRNVKVLKTSADAWSKGNYSPETWTESMRSYMNALVELAIKEDLVFQFHTGKDDSDPRKIFSMADEYPGLTYHLVHMGNSAGGHFTLLPRLLERLESHSIYMDTSWSRGFAPRWFYRELKKMGALDRMMFATDEPWGDFPGEFHKVLGLHQETSIERKELQAILYGNASKLYEEG